MGEEQWAVRVPLRQGEEVRRHLIQEGTLDMGLRPRVEGADLLLPVRSWIEGAERAEFRGRDRVPDLPRHELVGGIAILRDRDPAAAARLLVLRPSLHTVLYPQSEVEGPFRTRRFEVLAGEPVTRTTCLEYGHRFEIDLAEAYFSARLATERQRIAGLQERDGYVLDMFAGVGPFAITLAAKARRVIAVDINPSAVRLMGRNLYLNHTRNAIPVLADAGRIPSLLSWRFDRVVMNHPKGSLAYLPAAFRVCNPGGTIHCYVLQSAGGEALGEIMKYPASEVREHRVRSYSPGRWHAVYDIVKEC